jgi:hypothetical protein
MSKTAILITGLVGLGLSILLWAAFAARGDRDPAPAAASARPAAPAKKVSRPATASDDLISYGPVPDRAAPAAAAPASGPVSPETAAILERIRVMEDRARELEARRDELTLSNKDLERQATEKWAEMSAKSTAEWRVKQWETLLGLGESQKQALTELWTKWTKEDAGRPATRDAWMAREAELRSQLSAEQAAKLQQTGSSQAQKQWSSIGQTMGGMLGSNKDERARYQQSLGDLRVPGDMLLPEAHGADWPGMMRDATARLRPTLTPEQAARLEKMGWK